jgi:SAM-dependent methyltransferase
MVCDDDAPAGVLSHRVGGRRMDLSRRAIAAGDYEQILQFIRQRKLAYQPFRFDEHHEVGEGLAFLGGTSTDARKGVVHWPDPPPDIVDLLVSPAEIGDFRSANDALRSIYDHFTKSLYNALGAKLDDLDFAEFGCNTGYFLYSLSQLGARNVYGLDFTYNAELFRLFNRIFQTNAIYLFSEWDSLRHQWRYNGVPEVDVVLSVAVLCHLADPLHHLTYLCSRARKAVFLWTPSHPSDELMMTFGQPSMFANSMAWPVSFDNLIKPSRGLLEVCLKACGFEDIHYVQPIRTPFDKIDFWGHHSGMIAFRTRSAVTAYTVGKTVRDLPSDVHDVPPAMGPAFQGARHANLDAAGPERPWWRRRHRNAGDRAP